MTHGGCLCGATRYEIDAQPDITAVCHCKHCQRQSGSAFSILIAVPLASLHISGQLATFKHVGDGGAAVLRRFCPSCGSPIVSEMEATPGLSWVKAGGLDDTNLLQPTMQIFCASRQPWLTLDSLDSSPGMPPLG